MIDLLDLRNQIDEIDDQIVSLFEHRMQIAENVAQYKLSVGKEVLDQTREAQKIEKVKARANTEFNKHGVESLYNQIMTISRMRQYGLIAEKEGSTHEFSVTDQDKENSTVVFCGVSGAYGQQAMEQYFGTEVNCFNVETFKECMDAIKNGEARYGVLPIENSSTGSITDVYDLLEEYDNYIVGETVVRVSHALLGLPGSRMEDINTVYSHPQGLMQCREFLSEHRDWSQISLQNTAIAAQKVKTDQAMSQAAIASRRAAAYHGLQILKEEINDIKNNATRFIVISNKKEFVKEANGISICFGLPHASGTLYNILAHFIFNGLNMTKIESRPIKGEKWQYRFFVDFDGNLEDAAVKDALKGIGTETTNFRILGNYIKAE